MAMNNDDHILQASRYAEGEMDAQEQQEFELLLQNDIQLQEYLAQYKFAHAALSQHFTPDAGLDDLKKTLRGLNKQYFKPEAKVIGMRTYVRWLSGIAAVLAIALMIYLPLRKNMYEQYSTATTMSVTERGDKPQTDMEKAAAFYNKKEFTKAELLLAKEYQLNPKNSLTAFYYSVTLIEDKQEAKARQILQQLYAGESAFKYDAAYYMALSYIKQKDRENCKKWLILVPVGTSNYTKAQELLGKL